MGLAGLLMSLTVQQRGLVALPRASAPGLTGLLPSPYHYSCSWWLKPGSRRGELEPWCWHWTLEPPWCCLSARVRRFVALTLVSWAFALGCNCALSEAATRSGETGSTSFSRDLRASAETGRALVAATFAWVLNAGLDSSSLVEGSGRTLVLSPRSERRNNFFMVLRFITKVKMHVIVIGSIYF